jgi:hypothetical protein
MNLNFENLNYFFLAPDIMHSRISANDDICLAIIQNENLK